MAVEDLWLEVVTLFLKYVVHRRFLCCSLEKINAFFYFSIHEAYIPKNIQFDTK